MNDKLKNFTEDHREAFDRCEPPSTLWNRIETDLRHLRSKRIYITRQWIIGITSAAAIFTGIFFLAVKLSDPEPAESTEHIAKKESPVQKSSNKILQAVPEPRLPAFTANNIRKMKPAALNTVKNTTDRDLKITVNNRKEYVQNFLKTNLPELHERFNEDLFLLQEQYTMLVNELKNNTNRTRIQSAIRLNLEMQDQVVLRQLKVITEFKQLKNRKDEDYSG